LIEDPRFCNASLRVKNDAELDPIIREWTMRHTKHEAMALVGGAGIPAGAVLDTMELQNEQSFVDRGIMQVMQHPRHEPFKMPAWPVRVDGKTAKVKASPILGEHVDDVLTSWLGLGSSDLEKLKADGIV
jgi:crotonobetainyl-CoA:carnitine CoA-transferase CaiB-like acyl-CoA transferase